MIIDSHGHMGWYTDGYHSPTEVWYALRKAGVSKAGLSSTSTCAELYHNIKTEFYQLVSLAGRDNIKPVLWITPRMILKRWPVKFLLKSKIEWRGLKLHYVSHPQFKNSKFLTNEVVRLSRQMGKIPLMFHTGNWENCHASAFEPVISENPDLTFVLAHGRPIEETSCVMKQYPNVWTDTAFMSIENIRKLKEDGLTARTMFGSDAPINRVYYPDVSTEEYLKTRIEEIKEVAPEVLSNCVYDK